MFLSFDLRPVLINHRQPTAFSYALQRLPGEGPFIDKSQTPAARLMALQNHYFHRGDDI